MTTPRPARREADAWWESLDGFAKRRVRFTHVPFRDTPRGPIDDWWRSLPDERADEIRRKEIGG